VSGHAPTALSITVSPVKVQLPAGQLAGAERIMVTNTGPGPIDVHASSAVLSSTCRVGSAPGWVTVTPASKVLGPGRSEHATLTVHAPAGTTGTVDVAALFTASGQGTGNARVSGTVASQVLIHPAHGTPVTCGARHQPVASAGHSTGVPLMALAIAAALFAAAIAVFILMRLRRPHLPP
jgi:hypothetical protein